MAEFLPLDESARRLIAIDPGLGGTGWALWDRHHQMVPVATGVVRDTAKDDTLANRCWDLKEKLFLALSNADSGWHRASTFVYIEMPQHMQSAAGIAAQAGAIYKLTFLVGYLAARLHPSTVIVVTPGDWKGQLPKAVVMGRVLNRLGPRVCERLQIKSHAWDAVGIGLWALGRL